MGHIVIGAEADYSKVNIKTSVPDGNFLRYSGELGNTTTVRARLGLALDHFMPYVTAGAVWAQLEQGASCPAGAGFGVCAVTGAYNVSSKQTFSGWVYGFGGEYAVSHNWSLKGEALFTDLGTENFTATIPVAGTVTAPVDLDISHVIKLGVNYRF